MSRTAGPGSRPGLELESVSLILAQMSESESLRIRRFYILGHGYNSEKQEQVQDQCPLVSVKLIKFRNIRLRHVSNPVRSEPNVHQNAVKKKCSNRLGVPKLVQICQFSFLSYYYFFLFHACQTIFLTGTDVPKKMDRAIPLIEFSTISPEVEKCVIL